MEENTLGKNNNNNNNNSNNGGLPQLPHPSAMDLFCQSEDQYVAKLRELARQQQQDMLLKQLGNSNSNSPKMSPDKVPSPSLSLPLPLMTSASPSSSSPFIGNAVNAPVGSSQISPSNGSATSSSSHHSAISPTPGSSTSADGLQNSNNSSSGGFRHFKKKALMQTLPDSPPAPPPEIRTSLVPYEDDDEAERATNGSGDNSKQRKHEETGSRNGKRTDPADETEKCAKEMEDENDQSGSKSTSSKRRAQVDENDIAATTTSTHLSVSTSDSEPLQELKVLLLSPTLPRSKVDQTEKMSPSISSPSPKRVKRTEIDLSQQQDAADEAMEEASSEISATSSLETNTVDGSQETATDASTRTDDDEESGVGVPRGRHNSSASATSAGDGTNFSATSDVDMKDINESMMSASMSMMTSQSGASTTASDSFDFLRPSITPSGHLHGPSSSASFSSSTPNSSRMGGNRRPSPSASPLPHGTSFSPINSPYGGNSSSSFTTLPEMPTMVTHVGRKPLNGPPCSLKTLVDDGILDPLEGSLTYEILGSKFTGDLLSNGFIRMSATAQVFANPSSWANFCRSTIPSAIKEGKNYGSAWSIIRYLGKRLDSYKLRWYRKQKKSFAGGNGSGSLSSSSFSSSMGSSMHPSMMQLMASGAGSSGLANFHPHQQQHHSNSRRSSTATSADLNYTAQLLGLPMGSSSATGSAGHHHHSSGGQHGSTKSNIYSFMNRERLWKLDKISIGDTDLNSENINDPNEVVNFASIDLSSRDCLLREDLKVEAVPFAVTGGLQPFLVSVMTNVLMLVDFHAHLVPSEVGGFLGGTWDPRTQHMIITSAYPLMYQELQKKDSTPEEIGAKRAEAISRIKATMRERGTVLVGWYHSHGKSSPHPSIRDIKRQLRYQKDFLVSANQTGKGQTADYSPVVGLIVSPYYPRTQRLASLMQMFWVAPIYVSCAKDFGRPMQFNFSINRDAFLTQDLLVEMRAVAANYIKTEHFVPFKEEYRGGVTFWEKLHESMKPKLPRDLIEFIANEDLANEICAQALVHFWSFVRSLLLLKEETDGIGVKEPSLGETSTEKKTRKDKEREKNTDSENDKEKIAATEEDTNVETKEVEDVSTE